jgi:hypothetical protein
MTESIDLEDFMTLSVRLESALERRLLDYSTEQGVSKSEVVKQSLEAFFAQKIPKKTAWELGKHLFGRHDVDAPSDLSVNYKKYLTEALLEKHNQRRGSKLQLDAAHLPPNSPYALKPAPRKTAVKAVDARGGTAKVSLAAQKNEAKRANAQVARRVERRVELKSAP